MRPRPAVLSAVLLVTAVTALGACGGQATTANSDDFEGPEKEVAEAVYEFRDAISRRDEAKVCDAHFTDALREEIVAKAKPEGRGSTCADAIEESIRTIDAVDIEIPKDGIVISGDTATVKIQTDLTEGDDPTDTLTLANDRGWRISELLP